MMTSSAKKPVRLWQIVPDQPSLSPITTDAPNDPDNNNKLDRSSSCSPTAARNGGGGRTACRADRGSPIVEPCDVAFLGPYSFVVADSEGHRLVVADIERNVCSIIGGGHVWPNGVDVTVDGKILVTDRRTKGVSVYDAERGDCLWVWEPGEDVLRRPHGIATTPRGEAIVTDTDRCQICVFSVRDGPSTQPIRRFGSRGDQLQQLRLPFYCAYDARRDEILVADNMNYCVKIFDGGRSTSSSSGRKDSAASTGPFLRKIGSGNSFGQRQFQCPYGVTVDPFNGNVLVADYDTHRVFEYDGSTGSFVRYPLTGSDGCRSPCGIAVGPDCGTLVVTESAGGGTDQPAGIASPAVSAGTAGSTPWPANIKAYLLHGDGALLETGTDGNVVVWTRKTESAV